MRGKAAADDGAAVSARITPAHAGKRHTGGLHPGFHKDHPRACGEKAQAGEFVTREEGSPPRMRGKACLACLRGHVVRITPAHAGKRFPGRLGCNHGKDHPRACGEKAILLLHLHGIQGSPPRMRGKVGKILADSYGTGITPAHAGKSIVFVSVALRFQDHPRACGEKTQWQQAKPAS